MTAKKDKELIEEQKIYKRWIHLRGYENFLQFFFKLIEQHRLPQVILLEGREGIGKSMIAATLVARHFCEKGEACGRCHGCALVRSGQHSDLLFFEDDDMSLKIADAKLLQEHLEIEPEMSQTGNKSLTRPARIVVVPDIDRFNDTAVNKLLKILEELPGNARVICTTSRPKNLMDTLLSRCVRFKVPPPTISVATQIIFDHLKSERNLEIELKDIELLVRRFGRSPGKVLTYLAQGTLDFEAKNLVEALLNTKQLSAVLHHAQEISSDKKLDAGNLAEEVEIHLNQIYRHLFLQQQKVQLALDVESIHKRRQILRSLKYFAGRKKIKLNTQLSGEAIGLAGIN